MDRILAKLFLCTTLLVVTLGGCERNPAEPDSSVRFTSISAGDIHTCALTAEGQVYCWGMNRHGSVGNDSLTDTCYTRQPVCTLRPVPVQGGHTFATLSARMVHSCGTTPEGAAFCWGLDILGELGDGLDGRYKVSTPVRVASHLPFREIVAGHQTACALTTEDRAYCWGVNTVGQLGTGTREYSAIPTPVAGGLRFRSISVGEHHSCGLTAEGQAFCWGWDGFGQLGSDAYPNGCGAAEVCARVPAPVAGGHTFREVVAGDDHTCGVTTSGAALCWGWGAFGRLGTGDTLNAHVPTPIAGSLVFRSVAPGDWHSCGVTVSGEGYCWGWNRDGQLGNGEQTDRYTVAPVRVQGGLRFSSISAASFHSCGLTTDGEGYCWGLAQDGALGHGSYANAPRPVRVARPLTRG
jgi:alpha-tubulin suppressor-like RCC1 family protein